MHLKWHKTIYVANPHIILLVSVTIAAVTYFAKLLQSKYKGS